MFGLVSLCELVGHGILKPQDNIHSIIHIQILPVFVFVFELLVQAQTKNRLHAPKLNSVGIIVIDL